MADVKEMTSKALERAGSATPAKKTSRPMRPPELHSQSLPAPLQAAQPPPANTATTR